MESSTITQILKMKVPQLRRRAEELGVETKGRKAELIDRINKHLEKLIIDKIDKCKKNQDNSDEEKSNDSNDDEENNHRQRG
jgi:hypothetical protein